MRQVKQLKDQLMDACGDKENVGKVIGQVQDMVQKLALDKDTQKELLHDGEKVWDKIEQNEEVWSLVKEATDTLGDLNVGADEKILENDKACVLHTGMDVLIGSFSGQSASS